MTKKRFSFHFSSERIKLQTFALTIKSSKTTLESRIDSFLSNLRSSVLKGNVKVGKRGRAKRQRLPVNRERS